MTSAERLWSLCLWQEPPPPSGSLALDAAAVHIWRVDLDTARTEASEAVLSPEERERANRFLFAGDRQRFVVARGALRVVLGRYLYQEPRDIQIGVTSQGKPELPGEKTLRFNVTHSDNLALFAFTLGQEVGIDTERLRSDFDPLPLAKRFFAPAEYEDLCRVPVEEQRRVYFAYWTCKEAYLKAIGTGLRHPLRAFAVSPREGIIYLPGAEDKAFNVSPFRLQQFHPAPGYVAAIAVERCQEVRFYHFAWPGRN